MAEEEEDESGEDEVSLVKSGEVIIQSLCARETPGLWTPPSLLSTKLLFLLLLMLVQDGEVNGDLDSEEDEDEEEEDEDEGQGNFDRRSVVTQHLYYNRIRASEMMSPDYTRGFDVCASDEDSTAAKGEKRKRDVEDEGDDDEDD